MNITRTCSRREFLRSTAVASVALTASYLSIKRPFSAKAADVLVEQILTPSWVRRPMRWAQLTLVEDDPGKFDPKFWLDYFKRSRSDAVCLSAGGCVAYYPTAV